MAVYTHLSDRQISQFLARHYDLKLVDSAAINAGTENSNYQLHTERDGVQHAFVLTLFEHMGEQHLKLYLDLMQTLESKGLMIPLAANDTQHRSIHQLADKPCILTPFIVGQHPTIASPQQCNQIAHNLALIHTLDQQRFMALPQLNIIAYLFNNQRKAELILTAQENTLLQRELDTYRKQQDRLNALPSGIIHSDLFRDNTLFMRQDLSAILDFYNAQRGIYLYDLAVLVNDWCFDHQHFLALNYRAIIDGYTQKRPLSDTEHQMLPYLLRIAACRFWLSRLILQAETKGTEHTHQEKSPDEFKQRLLFHLNHSTIEHS